MNEGGREGMRDWCEFIFIFLHFGPPFIEILMQCD
jgi:hypothetical protein